MNEDEDFRDPEPLTEGTVIDWTSRIRTGERGEEVDAMAKALLQDFCVRQWHGIPHSQAALGWIADVFAGVMDHHDARELLGLQPRAKNRPSNSDVQFEVACWVRLAKDRGYTTSEANLLAAQIFHRDPKTVERDVRVMKEWVSGMNLEADWDSHFLSNRRPLPAARPDPA